MIFYIFIVSVVVVLYLYGFKRTGSRNLSNMKNMPTLNGLPIIGLLHKIEDPLCNYLVKLAKTHGPIYRVKFGMRDIVVLNTFEFIKSALVDNGDALSGRWKSLKHIFVTNNSGLVFIDGEVWTKQRHFVLKTLKDFGMGKSRSEEIVHEECIHMLDRLRGLQGKSVDLSEFMTIYSANVISKFAMNKRFTHEDPELQLIKKIVHSVSNEKDPISNLCLLFPFIENNEWLIKFVMWVTSRKSQVDSIQKIIEKEIKEHVERFDVNSEGEDLVERFLITQHQLTKTKDNVGSFTEWQLIRNVSESIISGFDTTSSTLTWSFMLMAMNPDIQDKVHREIVDQIGNERLPKMSDKVSLNYTQAVMDEILRLGCVAPLSITHRTLDDVCVKGYFIAKDTLVIPNIFACHLDSNVWEKPFQFYPKHFLTTETNGTVKYKPRQELIPFSMGKRQCIGESLARMEYFIFFTSILQRFQVSMTNEDMENRPFDVFNSRSGLVRTPNVNVFTFKSKQKICKS